MPSFLAPLSVLASKNSNTTTLNVIGYIIYIVHIANQVKLLDESLNSTSSMQYANIVDTHISTFFFYIRILVTIRLAFTTDCARSIVLIHQVAISTTPVQF